MVFYVGVALFVGYLGLVAFAWIFGEDQLNPTLTDRFVYFPAELALGAIGAVLG